jgi:hypothetical protein
MWRKESRYVLRLYLGMRRQRSGLSDTLQGRKIDDKDAVPCLSGDVRTSTSLEDAGLDAQLRGLSAAGCPELFDEVGVQRSPALRSLQTT